MSDYKGLRGKKNTETDMHETRQILQDRTDEQIEVSVGTFVGTPKEEVLRQEQRRL